MEGAAAPVSVTTSRLQGREGYSLDKYWAVAVQTAFSAPRDRAELDQNIDHALEVIRWGAETHPPARLIALGELSICGFRARTIEDYQRIAIEIPGPETDRFVGLARELGAYLVPGSWIETRNEHKGVFFNTCFLAGPEGVLAKYSKVNPVPWMELSTSPHDLLDKGYDRLATPLFPVVETEIGNIGMMICYDSFFPEVARQLAYNGAEILVVPYGNFYPGGDRIHDYLNAFTRVRSIENLCYGLYVNSGSTVSQFPPFGLTGHSQIVDFEGRVLTILEGGEAVTAARFDIDLLRELRKGGSTQGSLLAYNRLSAYDYWGSGVVWSCDQEPSTDAVI
jgi:formamidase